MRRYETTIIAHPSLSPEERQPFFDKLTKLLSDGKGLLIKFDEWGQKGLAYAINKQTRGYYIFLEFCGDGTLVKELERNIRLDDRALKYMTICTVREVDEEKVKAEIEVSKQQEETQSDLTQEESLSESDSETLIEETPEPASDQEDASGSNEKEGDANGSVSAET